MSAVLKPIPQRQIDALAGRVYAVRADFTDRGRMSYVLWRGTDLTALNSLPDDFFRVLVLQRIDAGMTASEAMAESLKEVVAYLLPDLLDPATGAAYRGEVAAVKPDTPPQPAGTPPASDPAPVRGKAPAKGKAAPQARSDEPAARAVFVDPV